MSNLNIALKPRVLESNHLLEGRHSCAYIAHLDADFGHTAQIVKVLLIFHSLDATLGEIGEILS